MWSKKSERQSDSGFEQSLRRVARDLPEGTLSEGSEAKLLARLPETPPVDRVRRRYLGYGIAAVASAAVGTALLIGPGPFLRAGFAADMDQAIRETTTWHLSGWRLKNGQKVKWEVWGRRSPFLYQEQVGDEILRDNGTRRLHILPPDPANGRNKGVAIYLPAQPLETASKKSSGSHAGGAATSSATDIPTRFLVGIGGDSRSLSVREQRAQTVTLSGYREYYSRSRMRETTTLLADATTHLPRKYQVQRETLAPKPLPPTTEAELNAAYDVPLPPEVADVDQGVPAGYTVLDLTAPNPENTALENTATRRGLTVQARVVGQNSSGTVHVKLHALVGGLPFRQRDIPLALMPDRGAGVERAKDDLGNTYVVIAGPPRGIIDTESPDVWLSPVTPLKPGGKRPRRLEMTIPIRLEHYERMGDSGRFIPLFEEEFAFDTALPSVATNLGWGERKEIPHRGAMPTQAMEEAQERAIFHAGKGTQSRGVIYPDGRRINELTPAAIEHLRQAVHWWNVAAQEADRAGLRVIASNYRLNAQNAKQRMLNPKSP